MLKPCRLVPVHIGVNFKSTLTRKSTFAQGTFKIFANEIHSHLELAHTDITSKGTRA